MSPIAVRDRPLYSIACLPADGIGPEVIDAGVEVLKTLSTCAGSFELQFEHYDWSSETYKKTGKYIPDGGLESLKKHDAILFGAVGAPGKHESLNLSEGSNSDQTSLITYHYGAYDLQFASRFNNMQMSDQLESSEVQSRP